ncbi:MAG TPA: hypothetical protein VL241_07985 [Gemmatimonadales bacterium]|nr:hypothetical protein [Gemmatimonadales bacterium]
MTAGIPGAGIGGLFYLINALLLQLRGLRRRARGEAVPWRALFRQAALAAGILAGIWLAGWGLGLWLGSGAGGAPSPLGAAAAARTARLLGAATQVVSCGTLAAVLLSVQLARLMVRRSR